MGHIFISYSRKNKDYAIRLKEALASRGIGVWIDEQIETGQRWTKELQQAIETSDAVVVIMSTDSRQSEWVERELLYAQTKLVPIVPLLLSGEVFFLLIDRQFEDVTHQNLPSESFYNQISQIMALQNTNQSLPSQAQSNTSIQLSEKHRSADLRLLNELWQHVNTDRIQTVVDSVSYRNLPGDYYRDTVEQYLYKRTNYAEKHFLSVELEEAFRRFDDILYEFHDQLLNEETLEPRGEKFIFVPAYKRPDSRDDYQELLQDHKKTNELGKQVREAQKKLVQKLKFLVPDFDFDAAN